MMYALSRETLQQLADATHADPFAVLGRHADGDDSVCVRVLLPHAETVTIAEGNQAMQRVDGTDVFEWHGKAAELPERYRLIWRDQDHREHIAHDPYCFPPQLPDFDMHLFGEGRHWHAYRLLGARVHETDEVAGVLFSVWAPNAARVSVVGDFNRWDGRCHPMRVHGNGVWELFIPDLPAGVLYKFEIRARDGSILLKTDPYGRRFELRPNTAAIVEPPSTFQWRDDDWRKARAGARLAAQPNDHLRGASRLLAARPRGRDAQLSRAGRAPGGLCAGPRLYAHRTDARHRAPVRPLLGLSDHRLLRTDQPLRQPGRFPLVRRPLPCQRHRRDPGLGTRAFPEGRPRPRPLRRHRAVRARGPAPGRAPGLGDADLQLRPHRGEELPGLQRPVLAGGVPRRRPARRRRRLDAVSGLLAHRMGAEPLRRSREPGGHRLHARAQRGGPRPGAGNPDHGRGIHLLCPGDASQPIWADSAST